MFEEHTYCFCSIFDAKQTSEWYILGDWCRVTCLAVKPLDRVDTGRQDDSAG